jgi:hypothetical protein
LRWSNGQWQERYAGVALLRDGVDLIFPDPQLDSLWVGSAGSLYRVDEVGWSRYDNEDGMPGGAMRTIVRDKGSGGLWFGGSKGLTYFRDETTRPYVTIGGLAGAGVAQLGAQWRVDSASSFAVTFAGGDLQSPPHKVQSYYRVTESGGQSAWQPAAPGRIEFALGATGLYTVEVVVRDQSFNYSAPALIGFEVVTPPNTVQLPLVGELEVRIVILLLLFGAMAVVGGGYSAIEVLSRRRQVQEEIKRGFNPYISGEPVRRDEMFFGRHALLERIYTTLHQNSLMLHGERRIGKTTMLHQLANVLDTVDDPAYWFLPVYVDLEGTTGETFFHMLMEDIANVVCGLEELTVEQSALLDQLLVHQTKRTAYTDTEFNRDLRRLIRILEAVVERVQPGKKLRLILLLDEMDTFNDFDPLFQQQLRRIFMRDFGAVLGAVVAGIAINKVWDRDDSPWFNFFNEVPVEPFSREQVIELLTLTPWSSSWRIVTAGPSVRSSLGSKRSITCCGRGVAGSCWRMPALPISGYSRWSRRRWKRQMNRLPVQSPARPQSATSPLPHQFSNSHAICDSQPRVREQSSCFHRPSMPLTGMLAFPTSWGTGCATATITAAIPCWRIC